jgi:hypothetical protein
MGIEPHSLSLREREGARREAVGRVRVIVAGSSPSPFRAFGAPSLSRWEREP